MNPEFYPYIIGRLLKAGAVDAGVIPMVMKRGRPGALVQILCKEKNRKKLIQIMLEETTTLGLRYFPVDREIAKREIKKVKTKWGFVRVKIAKFKEKTVTIAPEYSDCAKIARRKKVPLKLVYQSALSKVL